MAEKEEEEEKKEKEDALNEEERDLNQAVTYALNCGNKSSEHYIRMEIMIHLEKMPPVDFTSKTGNFIAILYLDQNVMSVLEESKKKRAKKGKQKFSTAGNAGPAETLKKLQSKLAATVKQEQERIEGESPLSLMMKSSSPTKTVELDDKVEREADESMMSEENKQIDNLPPDWVEKFRTEVVFQNNEPIFNDSFIFACLRYDLVQIKVEIYH